jgi:hypothetical protein
LFRTLADVNAFMGDMQDLLLPARKLATLNLPEKAAHGKA